MSSLQSIRIKEAYLSSTFNKNAFNITRSIESIDYYEDLLNPTLTCYVKCIDTDNLYQTLPIRGYERLDLVIDTSLGELKFNSTIPLYVTSVQDLITKEGSESFTLVCSTKSALDNEAIRCQTRFKKSPISTHVEYILKDLMKISDQRIFVERYYLQRAISEMKCQHLQ